MDTISNYIKSQARNKIVFFKEDTIGIEILDIGKVLSEAIYNLKETGNLSMRASNELNNILQNSINQNDEFGSYLAISNLGILFEPELKLDFLRLLDNYSQNNALFVQWPGDVDSNSIFFLTREKGIKINLKNLSHIVL